MSHSLLPGSSSPLGATPDGRGANFSLYSRPATGVELLFFNQTEDIRPAQTFLLDPAVHRTYHYWHAYVPGVKPGQLYAYRVQGPFDPPQGLRFDPTKHLLDPYGRGVVVPRGYSRQAAAQPGEPTQPAMKSVVVDPSAYAWEGDEPLKRSASKTIIYEAHVRGFTRHPNSGLAEEKRGTYAGMIEKIPYLKALGITAVELLPVFHFDSQDAPAGKINYWGYAPISFFAPHPAYSSRRDPLGPLDEFRDLVKALHRAGIEVILDVVFNHTAEGNENGPVLSFRGIDNEAYYILEPNRTYYSNYTGCGNTFNANHPAVRRLILDTLRYWVRHMHVDGFRFDLASILTRDEHGAVLPNPPILWDIESDPLLAGTKLLAEAWDAAGLYQVGSFVGDGWREWNGRFRDDVRDFMRGAGGSLRRFADRMVGSPEVFGHEEREAEQSINFVTCHDGFTLNDLVSYNEKHNEDNGEGNQDGASDNRSWNCGVEGPSADPAVEALRNRQVKNFLTVTLLALGVPMIVMGDECRRTQRGNNNAYCQDNDLSWFDWTLVEKHADVHRFFKLLSSRRLLRDEDHEQKRISLNRMLREAIKSWGGARLNQPDWSDGSHCLSLTAEVKREKLRFHLMLNLHWEASDFEIPFVEPNGSNPWKRWIDTALPAPQDILPWQEAPLHPGPAYRVESRSVVVLYSRG